MRNNTSCGRWALPTASAACRYLRVDARQLQTKGQYQHPMQHVDALQIWAPPASSAACGCTVEWALDALRLGAPLVANAAYVDALQIWAPPASSAACGCTVEGVLDGLQIGAPPVANAAYVDAQETNTCQVTAQTSCEHSSTPSSSLKLVRPLTSLVHPLTRWRVPSQACGFPHKLVR
eukprot:1156987-Pelagomonas_calceolata.AAC.3